MEKSCRRNAPTDALPREPEFVDGLRPPERAPTHPDSSSALGALAPEMVPAFLSYWGADHCCAYANRAFLHWLGLPADAVIGRHGRDVLGPIYECNRLRFEAALRGEPQQFQHKVNGQGSTQDWFAQVNYLPHRVNGAVVGVFALVTDISAVMRAEQSLRESEERFRLTLDEAPIGMALIGPEGQFLRVNRVLCAILGYTEAELQGMRFQDVTHPEDLDLDLALARQLARGDITRYTLEKRYLHHSGRHVHAELNVSVLRSADGQPVHFIAQVEDITERKRREAEHAFFAELGRTLAAPLEQGDLLAQVTELVTRTRADHCIAVSLDPETGTQRVALSSRQTGAKALVRELEQPHVQPGRPDILSQAVSSGVPLMRDQADGEWQSWLAQLAGEPSLAGSGAAGSVLATPLMAGGRVLGALAMIATGAVRRYDAQDLGVCKELAWRIAVTLDNARLYQLAQRAAELRDEVLAVVAHDLRNPLATIAAQATLLQRQSPMQAGAQRRTGAVIHKAVIRMARLIRDLLEVRQLEVGQPSIQPAALRVETVVSDAVESQLPLAAQAGITLHQQLEPGLPDLWADRDRLLQVFENLIGNAIKFSGAGSEVTVQARLRDAGIEFTVRDTGPGIAEADLPHLFDRFWRARHAQRAGSGLGLAIAKGLVEAHGGRIAAESTVGRGTCLRFVIPAARPDASSTGSAVDHVPTA